MPSSDAVKHSFEKSDCRRFVVNLDLPEEERWMEIVEAYRERIPAVFGMVSHCDSATIESVLAFSKILVFLVFLVFLFF